MAGLQITVKIHLDLLLAFATQRHCDRFLVTVHHFIKLGLILVADIDLYMDALAAVLRQLIGAGDNAAAVRGLAHRGTGTDLELDGVPFLGIAVGLQALPEDGADGLRAGYYLDIRILAYKSAAYKSFILVKQSLTS